MHLDLRPGAIVVESGTGSGALTTSLARSVAPHGHVYTFEFNADRVGKAKDDFARLGLSSRVTVTHADAYRDGFLPDRLAGRVDAVFLDLPQPWLAIGHATRVLKRNGRVCCYSPCMEQVMRNAEALARGGYEDVTTVECLVRGYDISPATLRQPPGFDPLLTEPSDGSGTGGDAVGRKRRRFHTDADGAAVGGGGSAGGGGGGGDGTAAAVPPPASVEGGDGGGGASESAAAPPPATARGMWPAWVGETLHRLQRSTRGAHAGITGGISMVASPSVMTRGHTAYLTFATLYRPPAAAAGSEAAGVEGGGGGASATVVGGEEGGAPGADAPTPPPT